MDGDKKLASNLSISQVGIDFITREEGFRAQVYADDGGKQTIGYGHLLLPGESFPGGVTKDQALQLLNNDLNTAESAVQKYVTVPITQPQFDALTSFTFNEGAGNLKTSTLLRLLNQSDYTGGAEHFLLWNKVTTNGELTVDPILVNRRSNEQNLFLNGIYK